LYDIDGFGNVSPPGQPALIQDTGETVPKPQGSSLEHTPDPQQSPAVQGE
jgi:hypothetical protein